MTNDEYQRLVEFLGERFTAIDQRFAAMERRVDDGFRDVDARFREVLGHFDEVYRRLDRLEQEYLMITEGLRRIEAAVANEQAQREFVERGLAELKERVALLQARIDDLERRIRG